MFKKTDFKLILRDCPEELNKLLELLEIDPKKFDGGDEYDHYQQHGYGKLRSVHKKPAFRCLIAEPSSLNGFSAVIRT